MIEEYVTPQLQREQSEIKEQPNIPIGNQDYANNPYQPALTDQSLHTKPDVLSVNEYAAFEFRPGLDLSEPEGSIWSAAWHNQGLGLSFDIVSDMLVSREADPNYNVLGDIPDRYLDETNFHHYVDAKNTKMADAVTRSLDREYGNRALIDAHPWQYFGATLALTPIDPIFLFFPGSTIAKETAVAWKAAGTALSAKMIAKDLGKMALTMGAEGTFQQGATEFLKHQTQELVTLRESMYDTMASGLLTAALGPLIPGGAAYIQTKKQASAILAGSEPSVSYAPKNTNFRPHGYEMLGGKSPAEVQGIEPGTYIPGVPKWIRKTISMSAATQLMESESINANAFSTDIFTLPFRTSENVSKNKASSVAMDQVIMQYRRDITTNMLEVDRIFRKQLGVEGEFAAGVRTRIAEKMAKNGAMNREQFSIAVADVMDSGQRSIYAHVNDAVDVIQNKILTPTKERLVSLGLMHKKFLDPEFNNYFTRMWLRDQVKNAPNDFKAVALAWFKECNDYYRAHFDEIETLNKPVLRNQKNLDIVNRKIRKHTSSAQYKDFQANKRIAGHQFRADRDALNDKLKLFKKARTEGKRNLAKLSKEAKPNKKKIKHQEQLLKDVEDSIKKAEEDLAGLKAKSKATRGTKDEELQKLQTRRDEYKKNLEIAQEALYSYIPAKYLTPDGHIPTVKMPADLEASAEQTLTRILGLDLDNVMNPVMSFPGTPDPNPLQLRVFTIPSGYTTNILNGDGTVRTVNIDGFRSKDIWRMVDNYSKATAAPVSLTQLAKDRGFKDITELKRWYLENVEKDYRAKIEGKEGKESAAIYAKQEKDYKNIDTAFRQMYDVAGRSISIFGADFAKFNRRARMFNSVTLMGSAALSSLTDLTTPLFRQGLLNSFVDWVPTIVKKTLTAGLTKGTTAYENNLQLIKDLGFAINTELGFRMKAFLNEEDLLIKRNWWAATVEPITSTFGNINRINQITDLAEGLAGHLSIARTLRILDNKFRNGKYSETSRIRNRSLFLDEADEKAIYDMWKEAGATRYEGSYASSFDKWQINTPERAKAAENFKASIAKDLSKSQLKASKADLPNIVDSDVGSLLFQFKDWMLAANNNLLYAGIQKIGMREYDVVLSIGAMMAMGQISYIAASLAKDPTGEKLDLSAAKLTREGLDRSGILGVFMEPINVFQKWGWFPGQAASRYYSVGIVGSLAGPTFGRAVDVGMDIGKMLQATYGTREYTTNDAKSILRLLPYQNLFYLRYLNEQLFTQMAMGLGAQEA